MAASNLPFNRTRWRIQQRRSKPERISPAQMQIARDYLRERLEDFSRTFESTLIIGPHTAIALPALEERSRKTVCFLPTAQPVPLPALSVCGDEEFLPFPEQSFDLILAPFALHRINDLPGALIQMHRALRKDGLLLAIIPGGETLLELRDSLLHGALAAEGGVRPYVIPFIDVRSGGMLLQRAGFAMPVADSETFTFHYPDMTTLLHDLRTLGESAALNEATHRTLPRATLAAAAAHYKAHHTDANDTLRAKLELVTLTGWKL